MICIQLLEKTNKLVIVMRNGKLLDDNNNESKETIQLKSQNNIKAKPSNYMTIASKETCMSSNNIKS